MFLNYISLDFCKKPREVPFDLNFVFSLSCKISFADLWSLFTELITNIIFIFFEALDVRSLRHFLERLYIRIIQLYIDIADSE